MIKLVLSIAIFPYLASPRLLLTHISSLTNYTKFPRGNSACDIFNVGRITSGDDGVKSSVVRSICWAF